MGYIPSPDWSRDVIVRDDPTHGASKFLGGQGAFTLLTLGVSQLGNARHLKHVTSPAAAETIQTQQVLTGSGGIYATGGGKIGNAVTNIVTRPNIGGRVPIPGPAMGAFRPIPAIGPISSLNRFGANGYLAPCSSLNLGTGATTPLRGCGLLGPQLMDIGMRGALQSGAQSQMGTLPFAIPYVPPHQENGELEF